MEPRASNRKHETKKVLRLLVGPTFQFLLNFQTLYGGTDHVTLIWPSCHLFCKSFIWGSQQAELSARYINSCSLLHTARTESVVPALCAVDHHCSKGCTFSLFLAQAAGETSF